MTNLSELLPSGGGAKEFSAVASGTLASGQVVILKSDGKVEAVGTDPASLGTSTSTFGGNQGPSLCKLTDTTFLVTGRDSTNSYTATTAIGTVSNGSISFGTKAAISAIGATSNVIVPVRLTDNKFVLLWTDFNDGPNKGKAIVGEVSGGSISYGSAITFEAGQTNLNIVNAGVALTTTKFIIVFEDSSNSGYAKAIVGNVSGTTITFGTPYTYNTANSSKYNIVDKLSDTQVIIAFSETPQGERGRVLTATISGTSISFGSQVTYDDGGSLTVVNHSIVALSETQFVISYLDKDESNFGRSIVGSVSGTTVSIHNTTNFNGAANAAYIPTSVKINSTQFAIAFSPSSPSNTRQVIIGTVASNTATFDSAVTFNGSSGNRDSVAGMTLLGTSDLLIGWRPSATESLVVDYKLPSTNEAKFIGITSEAIANTATGKVNPQGGVATSSTLGAGSASASTQYAATGAYYNGIAYDTNANRFLIAYQDRANNNYGTAVVANISGGTLSYGSPEVFEFAATQSCNVAFDSNANKFAIFYEDGGNSYYGTSIVATIDPSDNSVTFGTAVVFESATVDMQDSTSHAVFVPATPTSATANKVVVGYTDTASNQGKAIVGTISGTGISFGTAAVFNNARTAAVSLAYDSNEKRISVGFKDRDNSNQGTAVVGTVAGTGISFGAEEIFETGTTSKLGSAFDPDTNNVIISYQDNGDSNYAKAVVGTISSTSISFGNPVTVLQATSNETSVAYDTNLKKVVVSVDDGGGARGIAFTGTVSGTDISFDSGVVFETNQISHLDSAFDPDNNKVAIVFDVSAGKGVVLSPAGAPAPFVIGSTYYVQNDGTLTTTASAVTAGKAISTTQLILNGAS